MNIYKLDRIGYSALFTYQKSVAEFRYNRAKVVAMTWIPLIIKCRLTGGWWSLNAYHGIEIAPKGGGEKIIDSKKGKQALY